MKTITNSKQLAMQASNPAYQSKSLRTAGRQPSKIFLKAKRFLVLMMLSLASIYYANAQSKFCDNPCTLGPVQNTRIDFCWYKYTGGTYNYWDPITHNCIIVPLNINEPCVFVIVNYQFLTCPDGTSKIIINSAVCWDDRDYIQHEEYNFPPCAPPSIPPPSCSYPRPLPIPTIKSLIADAISQVIPAGGTTYDVYFKNACFSLVKLSFPAGSFFTTGTPNDLGHIDTTFLSGTDIVTQSIPCDSGCCEVTYQWTLIGVKNDLAIWKWIPIATKGDPNSCPPSMPDYNSYRYKLTAQYKDPITGIISLVTGTVVEQEPCALFCSTVMAPPPPTISMSTGAQKEIPLEFSANPTLVKNFIHFTSNKTIEKIVVYGVVGDEVLSVSKLENNQLDISELKIGIYYVQVHLPNNVIKTVKILKQ